MESNVARRRKVFAYITSGSRIVVFDHADHPEAGTQVPAGTLRKGEDPVAGALREGLEESGLAGLVVGVLGETEVDMRPWGKNEMHLRTFVHLRAPDPVPEVWEHWEEDPDGETGKRYRFAFRWISLPEAERVLMTGHGALLRALRVSLDRS